MGKTTRRAVLLNKDGDSRFINKEDFKNFLNEFLKISKKKMASPPTAFEKALIVAKPHEEMKKKKASNKAILPGLLEKTPPVVEKLKNKNKKK